MPDRCGPAVDAAHRLPRRRQPVVHVRDVGQPPGGLAQQRVVEADAVGGQAVEHAGVGGRPEPGGQLVGRAGAGGREHGERRVRAADRGGRQSFPGAGGEPLQGPPEHLADHRAAIRRTEQFLDQQRIPAGPDLQIDRVESTDGADGADRPGSVLRHQPADPVDVQATESDRPGHPA